MKLQGLALEAEVHTHPPQRSSGMHNEQRISIRTALDMQLRLWMRLRSAQTLKWHAVVLIMSRIGLMMVHLVVMDLMMQSAAAVLIFSQSGHTYANKTGTFNFSIVYYIVQMFRWVVVAVVADTAA
jgi:hypothetical protein